MYLSFSATIMDSCKLIHAEVKQPIDNHAEIARTNTKSSLPVAEYTKTKMHLDLLP
jgi:hypothetical protein